MSAGCFPRGPIRLTKANVASLSIPEGRSEILVFDDTIPGFGLRLRSGGKRTWVAQYRLGIKQRRITLGSVETDEARKRARHALAKVSLGADPQHEKVEARTQAAQTLGAVVDFYLTRRAKVRLKPRSYDEVERHLKRHCPVTLTQKPTYRHKQCLCAVGSTVPIRLKAFASGEPEAAATPSAWLHNLRRATAVEDRSTVVRRLGRGCFR